MTNNPSEGQNHRLANRAGKAHPGFYEFCSTIQKEVENTKTKIEQFELGLALEVRNRRAAKLQNTRISLNSDHEKGKQQLFGATKKHTMEMDNSPSKGTILYSMPELSIIKIVHSCKIVHPFMQNCPSRPLLPIILHQRSNNGTTETSVRNKQLNCIKTICQYESSFGGKHFEGGSNV